MDLHAIHIVKPCYLFHAIDGQEIHQDQILKQDKLIKKELAYLNSQDKQTEIPIDIPIYNLS